MKGSVWSAVPPINNSSSNQSKPIILTGVISLLAAVDTLSHVDGLDELNKQLVFLVFTGKAWGYLDSRRFLLELDQQSDAVHGLKSTLIQLEVNALRSMLSCKLKVSSGANEALDALKLAQESLKSEGVTVSNVSSSNPGIPPSSLMAFLRKNSSTSGIVLAEFDTVFANKFYHSHLDDSDVLICILVCFSLLSSFFFALLKFATTVGIIYIAANINSSSIVAAAYLVARTLLLSSYITSANTWPSHYFGVVLGEPSSTPYPNQVDDISRFMWNFLADRASTPKGNTSVCSEDCGKNGGARIRAEIDGKGTTRLKFDSGTWKVLTPNSGDPMGMLDPVWTESNRNTIGPRVYTVQEAAYDRLVLLGGLTVTAFAYLAIVLTRANITKVNCLIGKR
ncbi:nicastrin-like isoform X2 [Hibiscus syriacus]|uniref:Nicastrin-like isoform X2 n=1 Tax=Hibiscus syriacus TaxID=106335 RepID=A0A6A3AZ67_HIBSY|nr:nicastrin-like isoform X2 [Hibiscus syriacus]